MSDPSDTQQGAGATEPTVASTVAARHARDHPDGPADLAVGWYRDASSPSGHRYWDGAAWIAWVPSSS